MAGDLREISAGVTRIGNKSMTVCQLDRFDLGIRFLSLSQVLQVECRQLFVSNVPEDLAPVIHFTISAAR
ncbi:MAG: hypothetical protein ABGY96_11560 [bacterium]